jgi:hypothetical protein
MPQHYEISHYLIYGLVLVVFVIVLKMPKKDKDQKKDEKK